VTCFSRGFARRKGIKKSGLVRRAAPSRKRKVSTSITSLARKVRKITVMVETKSGVQTFNDGVELGHNRIVSFSASILSTNQDTSDMENATGTRNKLPGYTSRRLHSYCPCMMLYDSVQLRCPRHATSHGSIYRRGGTRRWLSRGTSYLLGHVVCLGKSCVPPQRFCICSRATAESSRLSPWVAPLWFELTLWAKKKQKRLTKK